MKLFYMKKRGLYMYNVLDVCRYVINYSNEKYYGISNLKLQKILYFIQAYFLTNTKDNSPCFREKIEAWDFGPVVPEAYHEYKEYGSSDIPILDSYVLFDENNIWNIKRIPYDKNIIDNNDKKLINEVIDMFAEYTATDLGSLTHNQSPWIEAYRTHENNEISLSTIKEYFESE